LGEEGVETVDRFGDTKLGGKGGGGEGGGLKGETQGLETEEEVLGDGPVGAAAGDGEGPILSLEGGGGGIMELGNEGEAEEVAGAVGGGWR